MGHFCIGVQEGLSNIVIYCMQNVSIRIILNQVQSRLQITVSNKLINSALLTYQFVCMHVRIK